MLQRELPNLGMQGLQINRRLRRSSSTANRSAAHSLSCRFRSVIWLGCTSNRWASSASVLSPPLAANATWALNTAECARLALVAIVCSLSSPSRAINGSRSSAYRLVQISWGTSDFSHRGRLADVGGVSFLRPK